MTVQDKPTLKSYFNDGDVPSEQNYVDLIDTMGLGDMVKTDYDTNDDGVVNAADTAIYSGSTGSCPWTGVTGKPATYPPSAHTHGGGDITSPVAEATNAVSAETADVADSVPWTGITGKPSTYPPSAHTHPGTDITSAVANATNAAAVPWTGVTGKPSTYPPSAHTHAGTDITSAVANANACPWTGITGKPATYPPSSHTHGGGDITSAVANATAADQLDGYHATDLYRDNANFATSGYLDTSNYVDAAAGFRINGVAIGGIVMYTTSTFKTNSSWTTVVSHAAGVYTLTPAMFGYPSNAKALYVLLQGKTTSGTGYVGINDLYTSYDYPLSVTTESSAFETEYGIVHLDGSGNMILRVGSATTYVNVQVWGYFL